MVKMQDNVLTIDQSGEHMKRSNSMLCRMAQGGKGPGEKVSR